jgi:hypothetical protein
VFMDKPQEVHRDERTSQESRRWHPRLGSRPSENPARLHRRCCLPRPSTPDEPPSHQGRNKHRVSHGQRKLALATTPEVGYVPGQRGLIPTPTIGQRTVRREDPDDPFTAATTVLNSLAKAPRASSATKQGRPQQTRHGDKWFARNRGHVRHQSSRLTDSVSHLSTNCQQHERAQRAQQSEVRQHRLTKDIHMPARAASNHTGAIGAYSRPLTTSNRNVSAHGAVEHAHQEGTEAGTPAQAIGSVSASPSAANPTDSEHEKLGVWRGRERGRERGGGGGRSVSTNLQPHRRLHHLLGAPHTPHTQPHTAQATQEQGQRLAQLKPAALGAPQAHTGHENTVQTPHHTAQASRHRASGPPPIPAAAGDSSAGRAMCPPRGAQPMTGIHTQP